MMLAYVVFAVCLSTCLAQNILEPYNTTALEMFQVNDVNHDGIMERMEIDFAFDIYDTNPRDNIVSRHEYTQYINNTSPSLLALSHEIYNIYDVDGDHLLEKHDYDNFFDLMDGDGNKEVSENEFVRYWTILFTALGHLIESGGTN